MTLYFILTYFQVVDTSNFLPLTITMAGNSLRPKVIELYKTVSIINENLQDIPILT